MITINYLLEKSNLPGPRGNLELMYEFSKEADDRRITECLKFVVPDVSNSPEEFVGMCGIVGYSVLHKDKKGDVIRFLKKYAVHSSWRIREAVAIGIQEISENSLPEITSLLKKEFFCGYYEKRAIVAGLCEPKLLKNEEDNILVLDLLQTISMDFDHDNKLSDSEISLRKALAYGWSVVIVNTSQKGKEFFEKLMLLKGKHVKWIIRENLKKNRMIRMDDSWVESCMNRL